MKEPLFVEDLQERVRSREAPVSKPPSKVYRRKLSEHFRPGLRRSVVFHGAILLVAVLSAGVATLLSPTDSTRALISVGEQRSAIRVDVVDLPSLTLQQLSKVDPTLDVGAPPEPEAPAKPDAKIVKTPSKDAMVDTTQRKDDKGPNAKNAKEKIADVRARLRAESKRQELMAKLQGKGEQGEGRPVLAGNQLSEGFSTTGDVATGADVYVGKIRAHLVKNWAFPAWMTAGKLKARVLIRLAPDGRVVHKEFLRRSGNGEFDSMVERAIAASDPFPPPPEPLKTRYLEEGIEWGFPN